MLLHGRRTAHLQCVSVLIKPPVFRAHSISTNANAKPRANELPFRAALDVKSIRENPDLHSRNCTARNYPSLASHPHEIVRLHAKWLDTERKLATRRRELNGLQKSLQSAQQEERGALLQRLRRLKDENALEEKQQKDIKTQIQSLALDLPNLSGLQTPHGRDARIVECEPPTQEKKAESELRDHVRIGTRLNLFDFPAASTTSGWGFYYLLNEAERLEHALVQYARSVARHYGFQPCSPPSMVYAGIGAACGFRPRDQNGEQQVYAIEQAQEDISRGKPAHSLSGTAEIPFASLEANRVMDVATLPRRIVGSSRCYRAEAGARGRDTRGLYRVHEFTKVEMFAWTLPGEEESVFNDMLAVQKHIIRTLGLPFRQLEMPAHDLGASACRKHDIEVFFPSRQDIDDGWGEVTSTSICTDYQTRRLNTRAKLPPGSAESGTLVYPSTVNGTALAVPRVLAAILENHWAGEEVVELPEVLWPWMDGQKCIGSFPLKQ